MDARVVNLTAEVIRGLANGATYALLAIGLILVFRVSRVVNFAHGVTATLAVYVAQAAFGLGAPIALGLCLVTGFMCGVATEAIVHRVGRTGGHDAQLLATVALFMLGDGLLGVLFGADVQPFEHVLTELDRTAGSGGLAVDLGDLFLLAVAGLAYGGLALMMRTPLGFALRAIVDQEDAAYRLGLPVRRLSRLTWGIAGTLGAVAGLLLVPRLFLDPGVMFEPLLQAFAAAVLAGFASVSGALFAGLLLGIVEALAALSGSPLMQSTLPFLIILGALMWRPTGVRGQRLRRRL